MSGTPRGSDGAFDDDAPSARLDLRVVAGSPTDEELAAVIAVLQLAASTPRERPTAPAPVANDWDRSRRDLRAELPSAWSSRL